MIHYLKNRWQLEKNCLHYYGLRNKENLFKNKIPLFKKQSEIIAQLPKVLDRKEKKILEKLLGKQIVLKEKLTKIPSSLEEARFCKSCGANDFIIPGLEFKDGLCPLCQTQDLREELKSVLPLVQEIPKAKKSRFDVGLFYTGGNAKLSIENAKKRFPSSSFPKRLMTTTSGRFTGNSMFLAKTPAPAPPSPMFCFIPIWSKAKSVISSLETSRHNGDSFPGIEYSDFHMHFPS